VLALISLHQVVAIQTTGFPDGNFLVSSRKKSGWGWVGFWGCQVFQPSREGYLFVPCSPFYLSSSLNETVSFSFTPVGLRCFFFLPSLSESCRLERIPFDYFAFPPFPPSLIVRFHPASLSLLLPPPPRPPRDLLYLCTFFPSHFLPGVRYTRTLLRSLV